MLTIDVLADRLGLSPWQTRRLIYALRPVLGDLLKSTKGRPLGISPQAIGILERAAALKASGVPLKGLAEIVQSELSGNGKERDNEQPRVQTTALEPANHLQSLLEAKDALIEELRRDRDHWRELALKLQAQVEGLQRLAIPAPRKKRWWPWRAIGQ
jgi:DNA-binding transcriptional MerR regulator